MPAMHTRAFTIAAACLLASFACTSSTNDEGADEAGTDETADTTADTTAGEVCPEGLPTLELVNMTGNAIEVVHFLACDMSDGFDFPVPPPGLANGDSRTIEFPGPGCWILAYEGEGCQSLAPQTTPDLACGEVFDWMPDDSNHICQG